MNNINLFYNKILSKRLFLVSIIFLIFLFNLSNINKFKLDASADTLILENDTDYKIFNEINKIFPNNPFLILAYKVKNNDINNQYLENIKNIKIKLDNLKGIRSTFSIIDAPILLNSELSLSELNSETIKTLESEDVDIKKALEELKNSPIFSDQIINKKGNVTAIIAYLKEDKEFNKISKQRDKLKKLIENKKANSLEKNELKIINNKYEQLKELYNKDRHNLINEIRLIINDPIYENDIFLGGIAMIADDSLEYVKNDIINFGIGVLIFIILILFFLFRQIKWVLFPIITTAFSILSIMSFLGIMGWQVTVISSNFISLIVILTISMNVHIIVRYKIISKNLDFIKDISQTMREMFAPCIYTSLTTIVAFLSLIFSDIRPVIDFGWIMCIGLIITFLSSFIILPTLVSFFPNTQEVKNTNIILINKLYFIVKNKSFLIIFFNILLIIISVYGISKLKVENSFINYFKENTEIYKGMKLIDQDLGGTTPIDIVVKFKDEKFLNESDSKNDEDGLLDLGELFEDQSKNIDYWLTPEKLETIESIHRYLENVEEIGKVQSLQFFIDVAEQINKSELSAFELAIIYKNIPTELTDLIKSYLSIENNMIRFTARVKDSEDIKRNELINRIDIELNNKYNNVESINVNGLLVLYNNMLQSLFSSQIKSLFFVLIVIFLMFLILFKSSILSIAAIIPNIIAASFILGLIGSLNIPLDMMTITIAAITIGIAVDNSIHYIYRIKKEMENNNLIKSIQNCHLTVGNAILTTSITIAFGFSILLLSNFLPTIYFGIFTSIAMIIAMLGIMTTLPKILILTNYDK